MKKNTGITLIALVITIVILLILASVSISLINGNGRLFSVAENSKDIYQREAALEKIRMKVSSARINQLL